MADRYWVRDTGNWNDVTHWSDSSGGAAGSTIPTSSDNVFIDVNSFTTPGQVITIPNNYHAACNNFQASGRLQSAILRFINSSGAGSDLSIYGTLFTMTDMTSDFKGGFTPRNCLLIFRNITKTDINIASNIIPVFVDFRGNAQLKSDFATSVIFQAITNTITIDTGNFNVSAGSYNLAKVTINAYDSRVLVTGFSFPGDEVNNGFIINDTATIYNDISSAIQFTYNADASNFNGIDLQFDGQTLGEIQFLGTSNASNPYYIYGLQEAGVGGVSRFVSNVGNYFTFQQGSAFNIQTFDVVGSVGNLVTFRSASTGSAYTLEATLSRVSFIDVKDCIGGGIAGTFYNPYGVDSGGNTNWNFTVNPLTKGGVSSGGGLGLSKD